MAYAAKNYTHVQLIAYEVPTLQVTQPGNAPEAVPRLPVPALPDADSVARLRRMAGVVNYAANRLRFAGGDAATTLKIFVAPEFYFRPPNAQNAYSFNQMINILDTLRNLFVHTDFADWLFVPGSIFSSQPADAKVDQPGGKRAYFNTACMVKGGAADAPFNFVHKRLVSTIDGAPPNEAALHNPNFQQLLMDWNERKNNVWRCDNRTFGIEVCLDHLNVDSCRVLKTVLVGWQANEHQAPPPVDVHLLTSCGMEFNDRSSAARVNGYLLGVDGHPAARGYGGHSQVNRVTAQNLAGNATRSTNNAGGANMNTPLWSEDVPQALRVANVATYPERVRCYPKQQL